MGCWLSMRLQWQLRGHRDPEDFDSDPICESNDLKGAGDGVAACKILMGLCEADLRCLDAHAHLGSFVFERRPKDALRHYEVGVRIGGMSLPLDFNGLLPWGHIEEAERVFDRMLWLNPTDNQGVRFLTAEVRARTAWADRRE